MDQQNWSFYWQIYGRIIVVYGEYSYQGNLDYTLFAFGYKIGKNIPINLRAFILSMIIIITNYLINMFYLFFCYLHFQLKKTL